MEGRLHGLLDQLQQPLRPQDKLRILSDKGVIEKKYLRRWVDLRNSHVHPKLGDIQKPETATYQKLLDRIHSVHVLLCQTIYILIGYGGPYTDYGADQQPDKIFQLPALEPAKTAG
jgi:hypothetical protein